uniref:Overexpressed in colon carcinoma 1 protein n=1 Tax=Heterorhabditis bacteriophora TaxID=37862 RepID=A0A1I7X671_HETBA
MPGCFGSSRVAEPSVENENEDAGNKLSKLVSPNSIHILMV